MQKRISLSDTKIFLLYELQCYIFCLIGPIISMEAVEGKSVQVPCNVSAPDSRDKVYMVLWFKADTGLPLYR